MKHKRWINVLLMVGLLVSTGVLSPAALRPARAEVTATIWHVINEATGGCSSWIDACSLYVAVTTAVPDTEIWVAEGTYTYSGDRDVSIEMESGVALYGGFEGTETSRDQRNPDPTTNSTVLSGDIGVVGNNSDNRYHVVTASGTDSTAVLDGFTITAGNADGSDPYDRGGGMDNDNSSPTLSNVTFSGNSADFGGGMYNDDNSSPSVRNSILWNNQDNSGTGTITATITNDNSTITLTHSLWTAGTISKATRCSFWI